LLTAKHLAIVRAALTFWDEEMSSVDESIYQHYFHSSDKAKRFTPFDVAEARRYFNGVELNYALCEKQTGMFISDRPVAPETELSYQNDLERLVCILSARIDPESEP